MKTLVEKLSKIQELIKANLMPSIRPPGPVAPKPPKVPSLAPKTQKNPVKVAEQIKDPNAKKFSMDAAVKQVKASKNPFSFSMSKSEGNSYLYHIIKDGQRITTDPVSIQDVNVKYGGVQKLESSGHFLVPVKQEELAYDKHTGQWALRPKK